MNMRKTSLLLDDGLYAAAEKEAKRTNASVGRVVSEWAKLGRKFSQSKETKTTTYQTVDLGGPALLSLDSRTDWVDLLDSK